MKRDLGVRHYDETLALARGDPERLVVRRDGTPVTVPLSPVVDEPGPLGLAPTRGVRMVRLELVVKGLSDCQIPVAFAV